MAGAIEYLSWYRFVMPKRIILYHIFFWTALYSFWIFLFQNRSFTISKTLTVEFCYLIFIALDFYLIMYVFVPRFFYNKQYVLLVGLILLTIGVSACMRAGVSKFMNLHFFLPGKPQPAFDIILFNSFINIFIWVQVLTGAKMLLDRIRNQHYIALIEREKAASELSLLKAQINPHFLFNSLNAVYGHIDRENKTARNILLQFSDLLRYQLYECNVDHIGLAKEIEYIRNYVSIQRYRTEENLIVHLHISDALGNPGIPPLLLVTFIENAFKYVSNYDDRENKINISLRMVNSTFRFHISNTKDPFRNHDLTKRSGIGIANARRRLEILYPCKHQLDIKETPDHYEVNLTMHLT